MIDLHDKVLLPRSLEIGFHPFMRDLSASAPRIWCASLFAHPRGRYQPFGANSKISYKVGNWHSAHSLRRETAAAGSSLLRADLIPAFKVFTGLLDVDMNLLFLPPTLHGLSHEIQTYYHGSPCTCFVMLSQLV